MCHCTQLCLHVLLHVSTVCTFLAALICSTVPLTQLRSNCAFDSRLAVEARATEDSGLDSVTPDLETLPDCRYRVNTTIRCTPCPS